MNTVSITFEQAEQFEEAMIVAMFLDREGYGWSNFQDLQDRYDIIVPGIWSPNAAKNLVTKRLIESRQEAGGNAYTIFGRLTHLGRRAAIDSNLQLKEVSMDGQAADSFPPISILDRTIVDSTRWTGTQLILVDQIIIREARSRAQELKRLVYEIYVPNNAQSADLKAIVDMLIEALEMCEPEVRLIQRILASPKFKLTASIFATAATVRGAIGF